MPQSFVNGSRVDALMARIRAALAGAALLVPHVLAVLPPCNVNDLEVQNWLRARTQQGVVASTPPNTKEPVAAGWLGPYAAIKTIGVSWANWYPIDGFKKTACGRFAAARRFRGVGKEDDWNIFLEPASDHSFLIDANVAPVRSQSEDIRTYCKTPCFELEVTPPRGYEDPENIFPEVGEFHGPADFQTCAYGPWVRERAHRWKPEIHPLEAVWRGITGAPAALATIVKDESGRFSEREHFELLEQSPSDDRWQPWERPETPLNLRFAGETPLGTTSSFWVQQLVPAPSEASPVVRTDPVDLGSESHVNLSTLGLAADDHVAVLPLCLEGQTVRWLADANFGRSGGGPGLRTFYLGPARQTLLQAKKSGGTLIAYAPSNLRVEGGTVVADLRLASTALEASKPADLVIVFGGRPHVCLSVEDSQGDSHLEATAVSCKILGIPVFRKSDLELRTRSSKKTLGSMRVLGATIDARIERVNLADKRTLAFEVRPYFRGDGGDSVFSEPLNESLALCAIKPTACPRFLFERLVVKWQLQPGDRSLIGGPDAELSAANLVKHGHVVLRGASVIREFLGGHLLQAWPELEGLKERIQTSEVISSGLQVGERLEIRADRMLQLVFDKEGTCRIADCAGLLQLSRDEREPGDPGSTTLRLLRIMRYEAVRWLRDGASWKKRPDPLRALARRISAAVSSKRAPAGISRR